jgi:hypothetical protein
VTAHVSICPLLAVFIVESLLEAIDYQAVCPFDLSIGPWVCDQDILDLDTCILAEFPELVGREIGSQVYDDGIRKAEAVQDIRDEVNNPIWCELGYRFVLNPLGKLVDSHQNMGETAWRRCEGPNHVEAPTSKGPGWWYDEAVGRNMSLLAEELAILAPTHEILRVGFCSGPPETSPICLPYQRS